MTRFTKEKMGEEEEKEERKEKKEKKMRESSLAVKEEKK